MKVGGLKPIPDTFLAVLAHAKMRDPADVKAQAKAEAEERGYPLGGTMSIELARREILREQRNARKAARRLARTAKSKAKPKRCLAFRCHVRGACSHPGFVFKKAGSK